MSPAEDFYALLSSLLLQTAQNPDTPPAIPLKRWPAGSPEQLLLEDSSSSIGQRCKPGTRTTHLRLKGGTAYQSIFGNRQ